MRRSSLAVIALASTLGLADCGTPRSGPNTDAMLHYEPGQESYDFIELSAATVGAFEARDSEMSGKGANPTAPALTVAPNDVLRVTIYERSDGGLFAPMTSGGSVFQAVRVDEAGTIDLPYARQIRVAGIRFSRMPDLIRTALAGKAVDPEVHVELVSSPSHTVLVTGEVKTPGMVTTVDGPLSAAEAIARAGGTTLPAQTLNVTVRKGTTVQRLAYLDLLSRPAIYIGRGDQVIVEANKLQYVAIGAVKTPGLQEMQRPNMSLLDAIAQAGGLNDSTANPEGVFLFRVPPGPRATRPVVVHVDFKRPESFFLARRFALRPDDAIYVTNAPAYEFEKLILPLLQASFIGRNSASIAD